MREYLESGPPDVPSEKSGFRDIGGTGLVGEVLHKSGFTRIDGTDIFELRNTS